MRSDQLLNQDKDEEDQGVGGSLSEVLKDAFEMHLGWAARAQTMAEILRATGALQGLALLTLVLHGHGHLAPDEAISVLREAMQAGA